MRLVQDQKLFRDLEYLGAFIDSADLGAGARARLKSLVDRDFASRREFEAWHAKAKLTWDEASGRYRAE